MRARTWVGALAVVGLLAVGCGPSEDRAGDLKDPKKALLTGDDLPGVTLEPVPVENVQGVAQEGNLFDDLRYDPGDCALPWRDSPLTTDGAVATSGADGSERAVFHAVFEATADDLGALDRQVEKCQTVRAESGGEQKFEATYRTASPPDLDADRVVAYDATVRVESFGMEQSKRQVFAVQDGYGVYVATSRSADAERVAEKALRKLASARG